MDDLNPDSIRRALTGLIAVSQTSSGVEVQLPVFFPNGDTASVVVTAEGRDFIVHDNGGALAFLGDFGLDATKKKVILKFVNLAGRYGCEFVYGRVQRRCGGDDLAVCAAIVSNASRAVADHVISASDQPILDFRAEVLGNIREIVGASRFRENEEVIGESGYAYKVSAIVLDERKKRPISFVEPVKDHDTATKKFREFWDISRSEATSQITRISLYDDRKVWNSADLLLLQGVSNVVRLQDVEPRLKELLAA